MFASTASGFEGTPVTRRLVYFTATLPLILGLLEMQYLLDLAVRPHLLEWHQWWRIPSSQLAYSSQSQVLLALLSFYNLRVLERLLGPRKFLSFIVVVFGYLMLAIPVVLFMLNLVPLIRLDYIPPGQTAVIFALIGLYHRLVPPVYRFQLTPTSSELKFQLSDKSFVYLVSAQLGVGSVVCAGLGWLIGGLVYSEVLPGKNWRIPFFSSMGLEPRRQDPEREEEENEERRPLTSQLFDTFRT